MKKVLFLLLIFVTTCQYAFAQSSEDKRRIEEKKRKDLLSSELYLSETRQVNPSVVDSSLEDYFSKLLLQEVAVLSDVYKTLVILLSVEGQYHDSASQFNYLKGKGIVPSNIGTEANYSKPLRKGELAYMFAKAMNIKGGMTLRIFGLTQRYALKELVYQDIMLPGIVHDFVSGQELIWTLTQAADYIAEQQARSKGQ